MEILYPPTPFPAPLGRPSVFLAGSIAQGQAEEWQSALIGQLHHWPGIVLNPRRPNWNADWVQRIDHPDFRAQVEWELEGLEKADLIVMYLDPSTQSPISLLELGLMAHSQKMWVACPEGFWRKGNVDIVCHRYQIRQVAHWQDFISPILAIS
ncbi:MAG: hypothetical protein HC913_21815 [Microscillaceae bacterium]|nr:hypothetical protein [Microscillaceae bacterium]